MVTREHVGRGVLMGVEAVARAAVALSLAVTCHSLAVPPCPPSLSSDPPMQRAPGTFAIPRVGARNVTL